MRKYCVPALILACILMVSISSANAQADGKGKWVIQPFDYKGVTITDGPLRRQVDEVKKYYLAIPNDDLLKGFRKRAGKDAPGGDMGGWYSGDIFHIFGQIISGLSRMYAATGDVACRDKVNYLLAEWGKCIADDGYFFYSAKPNAPHYIYEKTVCGLVDAHLYCGNKEAAKHLEKITDWAIKNLNRGRGLGDTGTEWYTLSENLYRAYLATGNLKYRDFANVWEYTEYWDKYAKKQPIPEGLHAYSHVNTLSGAGAAYWVKGEPYYLDLLRNASDYIQGELSFVTGGFGPDEQLCSKKTLPARLISTHNTFETQCGSWAIFKAGKYLEGFTGDARYGDWLERLVINGIGASLPTGTSGRVMYYSDYNATGGTKFYTDGWTCCAGTRPQAVADYHNLVYFKDDRTLYVNLFVPSTVKWSCGGAEHNSSMGSLPVRVSPMSNTAVSAVSPTGVPPVSGNQEHGQDAHATHGQDGHATGAEVTLTQSTEFPEKDRTELTVHCAKPTEFTLVVRVPQWLAGPMTATLAGKALAVEPDKLHWARFTRTWNDGDKVTITLPMALRVSKLGDAALPAAVAYGPVALAFTDPPPRTKLDLANPLPGLKRIDDKPLTWTVAAAPTILVRPFYSYVQGEVYFMYLLERPFDIIARRAITFAGQWNEGGRFLYSNNVGVTAEAAFEGAGVRWVGFKYDDAGQAEVTIDGKVVATVDQYDPKRDTPFSWEYKGLAPGKHTIRLKLIEARNPKSKSCFINVSWFEAIPAEKTATSPK